MVPRIFLYFCVLLLFANPAICANESVNPPGNELHAVYTEAEIRIDPDHNLLKGNAILKLIGLSSGLKDIPIILNHELKVLSVTDNNGQVLPYERIEKTIHVHFPTDFYNNDTLILKVSYEGIFTERVPELSFMEAFIGPKISYALDRSHWYPIVSGTNSGSKGKIIYHVPINWIVTSSGRLAQEQLSDNEKQFVFEINDPVQYSFAAAPFKYLRKNIDGTEAGVFLLNGDMKKVKFYMDNCEKIVSFFKEYYGFFPYDGYSIVEIPQDLLGIAGGGSYSGLTFYIPGIFAENVFFTPTFGHELGHIWWGNLIQSPDGPVINEGLAQMSMGLYLEHVFGEKVFRSLLKNGDLEFQLWQSGRLYFQYVSQTNNHSQEYPGIFRGADMELGINIPEKHQPLHTLANSKGFFIYFMLRDYIGKEAFREALRNTLNKYAWSNTLTLRLLQREFENTSGKNLKWFFDQWFFRTGAPEFSINYKTNASGTNYKVKGSIRQTRELYRVNPEILFIKGESREIRNLEIKARKTSFSFILPFQPDTLLFDPEYKILRWINEFK